ncbi:flagellar hook-associated protein 1 FlgK [Litorimonas taeanensis]|uniref:Flagellar hook-associated protein 1 n=1 Tax=Litorimonas taeanensis TaxID=568099 RepID=A0A420WMC1_9PROT|nr:flagellar hook-associated protein FlgK [Litorimonas taeanensis]RKQ72163.1 flagellar hook-associated protein 1 FlgK [Litorimonas taeanensis]
MSLTSALSNANSGLIQSGIRADVAASNIANASNPNYAKREVVSEANVTANGGTGVRVSAIERAQDLAVSRLKRDANAAVGRTDVIANAYSTLTNEIGEPGSGYGLFASLEAFEADLKTLEATPESSALQNAAIASANETVQQFQALSHVALSMRETADKNIETNVDIVNSALHRIHDINNEINSVNALSSGAAALEDERQSLIDTISSIVPIKDIQRDNGRIDITTESGVYLLAGSVNEISFTRSPVITSEMRYGEAGSVLSGLFVGEQNITPGGDNRNALQTGILAGEFAVRDSVATDFIDSLDSLAVDLVSRFSDDSLDPTKAPGAQGLFTDAALLADPTQTSGAASRIKLNNAVNPNTGGEAYRLRDGIGATAVGNSGDSTLITNMIAAMTDAQPASASSGLSGQFSVIGAAAGITSLVGEQSLRYDSINASTKARLDILSDAEIEATGVDVDQELQSLLVIEQSYSANARVIQTIGDMINTLLSL